MNEPNFNEQEIIDKYLALKGKVAVRVKKLSETFNIPEAVVYEILRDNGFFCDKCKKFTIFKHNEAVEYYRNHKISIKDLAEKFNTSYFAMYTVLKAHGVKTAKEQPKHRRLIRVGSKHYKINIPVRYIRRLGFRGDEELYGKWINDAGLLKLVVSDKELDGAYVYKLAYSGRKTKGGLPTTRSIFLPAELVEEEGKFYEIAIFGGTLILSIH